MLHFWRTYSKKNVSNLGIQVTDLIEHWKDKEHKFKVKTSKKYFSSLVKSPFFYLCAMFCRIFGRKDVSHFTLKCVPLIQQDSDGCYFNWENILFYSLTQ